MKRHFRWAFNFAAATSAVLSAGTCVLWVRSCSTTDALWWNHGLYHLGAYDGKGVGCLR
jgi:hypothetical protein